MKASPRGFLSALTAAIVLSTALAGCDGNSPARSSTGTGANASGSPSAADGASGSAAAASGRAASGGSARPRSAGGGTSSPSPQAEVPTTASTDPCKITSAHAVTEAFGGTVITAAAGTSGTGASTCHYVLTRTRTGAGLVLDLSLTRNVSRSVFDSVKRQPGNRGVAGVGQDAYYRTAAKALQVYVRGSVAAMQATPTKSVTASQRAALRARQISLGKSIARQS